MSAAHITPHTTPHTTPQITPPAPPPAPPGRLVLVLDRAPGWQDEPAHRALRLALKRLLRDGRWRCTGLATGEGSYVGVPPPAGVGGRR